MNDDLISRSSLLEELRKGTIITDDLYGMGIMAGNDHAIKKIEAAPAVDAVSREVVEQIMWERDTAMEQLKEHGIPFGGIAPDVVTVVRCKDCKAWKTATAMSFLREGVHVRCCSCSVYGRLMYEDNFCSKGKRRADDAD